MIGGSSSAAAKKKAAAAATAAAEAAMSSEANAPGSCWPVPYLGILDGGASDRRDALVTLISMLRWEDVTAVHTSTDEKRRRKNKGADADADTEEEEDPMLVIGEPPV